MLTVQTAQAFLQEIPIFGWWATEPLALGCGILFWNLLALMALGAKKLITGAFFANQSQKRFFLICAGGTIMAQLLIYIYVGILSSFGLLLRDYGYPFIYFLTLALILISAIYFFALLISFIVGRLKSHQT